jgi:predicted metal-dependent phosphoesterase TrpH
MATQPELYERFRALHEQKCGFIMPNPWDGTSALLLKQAGFQRSERPRRRSHLRWVGWTVGTP